MVAFQVVVSPFIEVVFENLSSLIQEGVGLKCGVDRELKQLATTLSAIRDVIEVAEDKQITDDSVANWLLKLRGLVYEADDILDDLATESSGNHRVCLSNLFILEQSVKDLVNKFDEIAVDKSHFGLRVRVVKERPQLHFRLQSSSLPAGPYVYGRDEEKEFIVRLLLNNVNCQEIISVFPIVSKGGLGKTTLAQLCYSDQRVVDHFHVRIWICVSDNFDVQRLTKEALTLIGGDARNVHDLDHLQNLLQEQLAKKRLLLVLDDVSFDYQEEWFRFRKSFKYGARGSSVIVTTRLNTVASIVGTHTPLFLKVLPEDDCWSLFCLGAFGMESDERPNLLKIGHEIVKKCAGVPLAAKVLGGLLRFEHDEKEWLSVRDSSIWDAGDTVLAALTLGYNHLEPHLRQCFTYCSMFPKDYRMEKDELVRLWMANGFVQSKGTMQMEDMGNEIFNELSWRSFFQDEEKSSTGLVVSCVMHDLVHDLACSVNMKECYHLTDGTQIGDIHLGTRHLSLKCATASYAVTESIHQLAPNLPTLMLLNYDCHEDPIIEVCFKSLRALSLKQAKACSQVNLQLLNSIGNMKHLRYLNISNSRIAVLSDSLCELRNLQTLELEKCLVQKFPKHMLKMRSLRHLNMEGCHGFYEMPTGMGKLVCLRTLSLFIVGPDDGRRIKELQELDYLSGKVEIQGLEHVKTREEAMEANLIRKPNIASLKLVWQGSNSEGEFQKDVLEGLQPHPSLVGLHVKGYSGLTFPSWLGVDISSSLPNLVDLSISTYSRCEHLPTSLPILPLLRRLEVRYMESVKFFLASDDTKGSTFPSLIYLELESMHVMEDWFPCTGNSEEVIQFPCLEELIILHCPKLKRLPPSSLSLLKTLKVIDCDPVILQSLENLPHLSSLHICFNLIGDHQSFAIPPKVDMTNVPKTEISMVKYHYLKSLRFLEISGINDMTSLPKGLQNLASTLKSLEISHCSSLDSLPDWIGSFTNLEILQLQFCKNLRSLPDGLQQLTKLQRLKIWVCHLELHKRCEKKTGEDWPKIAHIPEVINNWLHYAM